MLHRSAGMRLSGWWHCLQQPMACPHCGSRLLLQARRADRLLCAGCGLPQHQVRVNSPLAWIRRHGPFFTALVLLLPLALAMSHLDSLEMRAGRSVKHALPKAQSSLNPGLDVPRYNDPAAGASALAE